MELLELADDVRAIDSEGDGVTLKEEETDSVPAFVIVPLADTDQDEDGETDPEDDMELLGLADDVRALDSDGVDVTLMEEETDSVPVFVIVSLTDTEQDGDGETDPDEDVDTDIDTVATGVCVKLNTYEEVAEIDGRLPPPAIVRLTLIAGRGTPLIANAGSYETPTQS